MLRTFLILSAMVTGLSACGTTMHGDTSPEGLRAKDVVQTFCGNAPSSPSSSVTTSPIAEPVTVLSAVYGEDDWVRADLLSRGRETVVHYHLRKGTIVCGGGDWEKTGLSFVKKAFQAAPPETMTHIRFRDHTTSRWLTLDWPRYGTIYEKIDLTRNHLGQRRFEVPVPAPVGPCAGEMKRADRTTGTWAFTCQDGFMAQGSYRMRGGRNGFKGKGRDSDGQALSYTIGSAIWF